jgi:hypothetical protein
MNRLNPNAAAVLGRPENLKIMADIEAPSSLIEGLQKGVSTQDRTAHALESVAYLIKKGEIEDDT